MQDKKNVLHLAKTSLAGAPIRIVEALNKYTNYSARLATYLPITLPNGEYMFREDITWQNPKQRSELLELAKNADIIHMHHYMNTDLTNPFMIDFNKITKPTCKILRHFHSSHSYIAKTEIRFEDNYQKDNLPKVVIPHYPERTFMNLDIVPNIIPIKEPLYMPCETNNTKLKIVYSASNKASRKSDRWATKGYPEVSAVLKQLSEKYDFEYIEINNLTFTKAMEIKKQADIVIGDVVTGSYHLTELEALSQGKPTITYLDGRSVMTFMNTFKTQDIPFINANIDSLEQVISDLISDREFLKQIGKFSRAWIEKYYDDSVLINKFVEIYDKILENKDITRENTKEFYHVKEFLYNTVYDYDWKRTANN